MCGLYTNTAPFYIRDFSILRLWYPCDDGVLELIFHRCQWDDYVVKMLIFTYHTYSAKRSQSTAKRWASLVAQWWRVCLPMQEPQVRSLIWKDPTCCAATKLKCHYWACALEPTCSATKEATVMRGLGPAAGEEPPLPATREKFPELFTATKKQCNQNKW